MGVCDSDECRVDWDLGWRRGAYPSCCVNKGHTSSCVSKGHTVGYALDTQLDMPLDGGPAVCPSPARDVVPAVSALPARDGGLAVCPSPCPQGMGVSLCVPRLARKGWWYLQDTL